MSRTGNLSINSENIFPIIKKWLYSDHDIFYRELVSNGCDAITKLKKLELMGEYTKPEDMEYKVQVTVNPDDKTIAITDNGLGMTQDVVESLLPTGPESNRRDSTKKGSGIGLKNVQERIRLYFGPQYGVSIQSEPDEGTTVTLHLPAVPYGEMEDT